MLDVSEWTQSVKIFVFPVNAHQGETTEESNVNHQVNKMKFPVGIS